MHRFNIPRALHSRSYEQKTEQNTRRPAANMPIQNNSLHKFKPFLNGKPRGEDVLSYYTVSSNSRGSTSHTCSILGALQGLSELSKIFAHIVRQSSMPSKTTNNTEVFVIPPSRQTITFSFRRDSDMNTGSSATQFGKKINLVGKQKVSDVCGTFPGLRRGSNPGPHTPKA